MKRKIWACLLTAAAVLWIGFIWGHSMVPADLSSEESGTVLALLQRLLRWEWLTEHLVRKAAHFTEYLILGLLCTGALWSWGRRRGLTYLPAVGAWIPLADETIQLFVAGRSGQISDVWLDMAGFTVGFLLLALLPLLLRRRKKGEDGNDFIKTK